MRKSLMLIVLCLALPGGAWAQATATGVGTGTATAIGGIQTGGTQVQQGHTTNNNVEAQPYATALYPAQLPGTPLNLNNGVPAFIKNLIVGLGGLGICESESTRQYRGELTGFLGPSGRIAIVLWKFPEQQEREALRPTMLLDRIRSAPFTTTLLPERSCVGSVFVISLDGHEPDAATANQDIEGVLYGNVRGVERLGKLTIPNSIGVTQTAKVNAKSFSFGEGLGAILFKLIANVLNFSFSKGDAATSFTFKVGYTTLLHTHQPRGVTIDPVALQVISQGHLFDPETRSERPAKPTSQTQQTPAQKSEVALPPKAESSETVEAATPPTTQATSHVATAPADPDAQ